MHAVSADEPRGEGKDKDAADLKFIAATCSHHLINIIWHLSIQMCLDREKILRANFAFLRFAKTASLRMYM